jgi:Holliday junction DNA helicase RuvA
MIAYLKGPIAELSPAHVIIECNGVGYHVSISITTYEALLGKKEVKLLTYFVVREDAQVLYGFSEPVEREMFKLLISVSGIGANTARMILSSMKPDELANHIASGNANILKAIKGIGAKSAERIIVDLKDKVGEIEQSSTITFGKDNTKRMEALSALEVLGFQRLKADKFLQQAIAESPERSVEELIKLALRNL